MYKVTPEVTLKGGIMEQSPQASSRNQAWSCSTQGSKGILVPVEIEAHPLVNGLLGAYNLGVLFTNAQQNDLYEGKSGGAGASDVQGYKQHNRTWFMYAGFNQQVSHHQDDARRGLSTSFSMSLSYQRSHCMGSALCHHKPSANARVENVEEIPSACTSSFFSNPNDWIQGTVGITNTPAPPVNKPVTNPMTRENDFSCCGATAIFFPASVQMA